MRVAIYARFSTDLQRQASIDDQFRTCLRTVERDGWEVVSRFKDEALSGAKADRPGYLALLEAAKRKDFDLIVVEEVSRLWRDQEEQWRAVRRLEFWGVHILGVNDGVNTRSEGYGLLLSIRGAMNEEARREIGKRTHRGLSGVALSGNSAGGRSYGYRHVPIEDPSRRDHLGRPMVLGVRREVDPEQAQHVRFIFERFADGWSPRRIADELNRMGVAPPGATWKRKQRECKGWAASAIYGDQKRGFGALLNPLYGGMYVWNRTRRLVDPDTKSRKHQPRPQSEWVVQEAPQLRIIPQELWERVQARMAAQRARSGASAGGKARSTGRGPKYLFSGLLKCGVCGGNFIVVNAHSYGCATHKDRGAHICSNGLKVPRKLVERRLLDGIKSQLLEPEHVELFKEQAVRLLKAKQRHGGQGSRRRLTQVETEIGNVLAAIKAGIITPTTKDELERLESEQRTLLAAEQGRAEEAFRVASLLPRAIDRYRSLVEDLEATTLRDVSRAREQIKLLVGDEIKLVPHQDHLVAEMSCDFAGLLKLPATGNNRGTEERT